MQEIDSADSTLITIRARKQESAFIYAVFEASENICACSTRAHVTGDMMRDVELNVPVGMLNEVRHTLGQLRAEIEGDFYVIES